MKIAVNPVRNPSFVRIFLPSILLLFCSTLCDRVWAQGGADAENTESPTVQARIERARALAAAHQLSAAAMELESLRSTTQDDVIRNVASVMLMSICLEEGNYGRAESLLEETFSSRQIRKDASIRGYFALAGQALNGARAHLARYRNFGINISDPTLPNEALNDLDRMRSLLERMSVQAKEIGKEEPRAYESLALAEEILGIRLQLARNDEDRTKWEIERTGIRRGLVSTQTRIASLGATPSPGTSAPAPTEPIQNQETLRPVPTGAPSTSAESDPMSAGSLNQRATRRVVPTYPQIAKNALAQGTVRVYITVDEKGNVSEVAKIEGPALLKGAAEDAARRWKFPPTTAAGKPTRVTGFIVFNFAL